MVKSNRSDPFSNLIITLSHSHIGGADTAFRGLNQGFQELGYRPRLITDQSPVAFAKKLRQLPPSIILWSLSHEGSLLPLLSARLDRHLNIYVNHGVWYWESRYQPWYHLGLKSRFKRQIHLSKLLIRQYAICRSSHHILHVSRYARNLFQHTWPFNSLNHMPQSIAYLGYDPKRFHPRYNHKTLRRQLGLSTNKRLLLMIGRADNRKNVQAALKLVHYLNRSSIYYQLIYIVAASQYSDFSYLKFLSSQVKELSLGSSVIFLTGIGDDVLPLYYSASDAYLMLSTHSEMFGLVTLEALASGIPVFGYASCATPEIVTHRPERFLTPPGKIRQLARLIDTYFSQPTGTIRKEKEAITRSVSHFTWPSTARQIIDNL